MRDQPSPFWTMMIWERSWTAVLIEVERIAGDGSLLYYFHSTCMAIAKYKAVKQFNHDSFLYGIGMILLLDPKKARPLIEEGKVVLEKFLDPEDSKDAAEIERFTDNPEGRVKTRPQTAVETDLDADEDDDDADDEDDDEDPVVADPEKGSDAGDRTAPPAPEASPSGRPKRGSRTPEQIRADRNERERQRRLAAKEAAKTGKPVKKTAKKKAAKKRK